MGKIVKYCAACDESFAEKFGFCPNCGQPMTAFEMNPLAAAPTVAEAVKAAPIVEDSIIEMPVFKSSAPTFEKSSVVETAAVSANQAATFSGEVETKSIADPIIEDEPIAPKTFAAAAGANGNGNGNGHHYQTTDASDTAIAAAPADDGFRVTVIEEKNGKQRNNLLLASMVAILSVAVGSWGYSLFNKDTGVGAVGDDGLFAIVVVDSEPMELLEKPEAEKTGDEGGGGGGGGRRDKAPISKGTLPPQFKNQPLLTPNAKDISVSNPALAVTRGTKGPNDIIPKDRSAVNGDPNSTNTTPSGGFGPDDLGMGKDGTRGFGKNGRDGMGEDGDGGIGKSPGSDYGNNPNGGPNGKNNIPKPPPEAPKAPVGVSTKLRIISQPKPGYTNEARQNGVTGTVRLKVIFQSSGAIGNISPISGLPYGLTEKAIAAARSIRFEPELRNGVPQTSSKTIEYSFTIY